VAVQYGGRLKRALTFHVPLTLLVGATLFPFYWMVTSMPCSLTEITANSGELVGLSRKGKQSASPCHRRARTSQSGAPGHPNSEIPAPGRPGTWWLGLRLLRTPRPRPAPQARGLSALTGPRCSRGPRRSGLPEPKPPAIRTGPPTVVDLLPADAMLQYEFRSWEIVVSWWAAATIHHNSHGVLARSALC
jgi:hypothetical protein